MEIQKKTLIGRLETKFATGDTDTGTMSGYGAVFSNIDHKGDIIAPGAFAQTIADHKAAGTMPLMLLNHDLNELPIGIWDAMEEDSYGLKMAGKFIDNTGGQDAYKTARAGAINGLSIGYIVTDYKMQGRNRIITAAKVLEVSLVTLAANDLARIVSIKSQENEVTENKIGVDIQVNAEAALTKLAELKSGLAELKNLMGAINIEAKGFQEEGEDCDDDDDCEDGCSCNDDGECQCDDDDMEEKSAAVAEHKYDEAAMSALSELRDWLGARLQ